jgi:peroxiredoxin family protein
MELVEDPNKYGVPTFEQYCKAPNKWKDSLDKMLASVDISSLTLKKDIVKQEYVIRSRRVDSLEELTHIAKEEGIDLMNCDISPQVIPYYRDPQKYVISVEFKERLLWTPSKIF